MGDRDIDQDWGDENGLLPNNLKSQLLAGATADRITSSDNILVGAGDEEEAGPEVYVPLKRNKGSKVNAFL